MNLNEYQRSRSFSDLGPRSLIFNIFDHLFLKLTEAKFHVEPAWDGGTKVFSNGPAHMTKMGAMPVYGKILKNLLWNQKADDLEAWHAASGTQVLLNLFK